MIASDLAEDRARALALTPVSRETEERLDAVVARLLQWQRTTNLIAPASILHLWTRHIADSLQLLRHIPDSATTFVDLGSGGGFPGLVLACALADRAGAAIHLVESNAKKCAFLRAAIQDSGVPATVHCRRIEDFSADFAGAADVVTARALAPLNELVGYVAPLLKSQTVALLPKGQDVASELTEATKYWNIEYHLAPSLTDDNARIVILTAITARHA
jgi:16S rRNA (guanine527-N7)-methyltransferase